MTTASANDRQIERAVAQVADMAVRDPALDDHRSIDERQPELVERIELQRKRCLDLRAAVPLDSLAYRFDIVLRGTRATVFENKLGG